MIKFIKGASVKPKMGTCRGRFTVNLLELKLQGPSLAWPLQRPRS